MNKGDVMNPLSNKHTEIGQQLLDYSNAELELDRYVNIEFVQYDQERGRETTFKAKKCYRTDFDNADEVWERLRSFDWPILCPENFKSAKIAQTSHQLGQVSFSVRITHCKRDNCYDRDAKVKPFLASKVFVTSLYSQHPNFKSLPYQNDSSKLTKDGIPFMVKEHELGRHILNADEHLMQDILIQENQI